jgi:hypothetical protein
MHRTLKQVKESIQRLIDQQGEDAPAAAWIFTNEDVFVMDDDGEQVIQPRNIAEQVLGNLDDYDYLYTEIFDCIDNELRQLGLQE